MTVRPSGRPHRLRVNITAENLQGKTACHLELFILMRYRHTCLCYSHSMQVCILVQQHIWLQASRCKRSNYNASKLGEVVLRRRRPAFAWRVWLSNIVSPWRELTNFCTICLPIAKHFNTFKVYLEAISSLPKAMLHSVLPS